jgi:hypothetical protein
LGLGSRRELETPLSWAYHLPHILCGNWKPVDAGVIRCPHCGSSQGRRKSRTLRRKPSRDAQGQLQTVEVFGSSCQNPACAHQTFINRLPDLLPYSP